MYRGKIDVAKVGVNRIPRYKPYTKMGFFEEVHQENTDKVDPRIVRNPIDKRAEYVTLCEENTELAQKLKQVDELLEQICFMGDDHGKDNWGNRALRCRLVLGMD